MPPSLSCCPSRFSLEDVKNLDNKSMMERETCAVVCMCVCVFVCSAPTRRQCKSHTEPEEKEAIYYCVLHTDVSVLFQFSLSLSLALSLSLSLSLSRSLAYTFLLHLLIGEPKQCAGRYVRRKRMNM
jgi:hypothetical protein